jgi:ketosteroid isomerase-like protein
MKKITVILFLSMGLSAMAQSKDELKVLAQSRQFQEIVFGTKDSMVLERLFAKEVLYVHSSGKGENREEAIRGISRNKSFYEKSAEPAPYSVSARGDTLVVNTVLKAVENKADGTKADLNLAIELFWIKEGKQWKLTKRLATKQHS